MIKYFYVAYLQLNLDIRELKGIVIAAFQNLITSPFISVIPKFLTVWLDGFVSGLYFTTLNCGHQKVVQTLITIIDFFVAPASKTCLFQIIF